MILFGGAANENSSGETQQKLDVFANEIFIDALTKREILCGLASEEEENFLRLDNSNQKNQNKYIVLIDPLDGSSNIDVNVSVGTIFSIYRRKTPLKGPVSNQDFLQKGSQIAAGYIIYGTSTMLVYTTGNGVKASRLTQH